MWDSVYVSLSRYLSPLALSISEMSFPFIKNSETRLFRGRESMRVHNGQMCTHLKVVLRRKAAEFDIANREMSTGQEKGMMVHFVSKTINWSGTKRRKKLKRIYKQTYIVVSSGFVHLRQVRTVGFPATSAAVWPGMAPEDGLCT